MNNPDFREVTGQYRQGVKPLAILDPVLNALNDGRVLKWLTAWVWRVLGVGFLILSIVGLVMMLDNVWLEGVFAVIYVILVVIFLLAIGTAGGLVFFYRARKLLYAQTTEFTVTVITSHFFRLLGELFFTVVIIGAVGVFLGALFIGLDLSYWILDERLFYDDYRYRAGGSFLFLLVGLLVYALIAFVGLVIMYLFAESTIMVADIAINARGMRRALTKEADTNADQPLPPTAPLPPPVVQEPVAPRSPSSRIPPPPPLGTRVPPPPPSSSPSRCPNCSNPLEPDDAFCTNCGYRIKND